MSYLTIILPLLGVLGLGIGVSGLFRPKKMIALIEHWHGPARFRLAIVGRLILGTFFIIVAPFCQHPTVIRIIGIITLVAAVLIAIVGQPRLDVIIAWWIVRPSMIRVSALFVILFGVFLIYVGS